MVSTDLMVVWMGLAVISGVSLSVLFFDSNLERYLIRKTSRMFESIRYWCSQIGTAKTADPNLYREENNDCRAESG